eukprot:GHVT01078429.1.p1 GENE.GHVT01078429.1~~GHVT01078429.1.p1  ORF type:complete len:480 (+),score=52.71 GHVT01078429.1:2037-3476(+)
MMNVAEPFVVCTSTVTSELLGAQHGASEAATEVAASTTHNSISARVKARRSARTPTGSSQFTGSSPRRVRRSVRTRAPRWPARGAINLISSPFARYRFIAAQSFRSISRFTPRVQRFAPSFFAWPSFMERLPPLPSWFNTIVNILTPGEQNARGFSAGQPTTNAPSSAPSYSSPSPSPRSSAVPGYSKMSASPAVPLASSAQLRTPNPEAEKYKDMGNGCYRKGFLESALMHYTTAINIGPEQPVYYSNRALCHTRLRNWASAAVDARAVLRLDDNAFKGYYFLGQSLIMLGDEAQGIESLNRAKSLAPKGCKADQEAIDNCILRARKRLWYIAADQAAKRRGKLCNFIEGKLQQMKVMGVVSETEWKEYQALSHEVMTDIERAETCFEPPDSLCCKISMEMMKDPVITPSGITYEREQLLAHLDKNGCFDPVTRAKCTKTLLVPNLAIKETTGWLLQKFPWCFDDPDCENDHPSMPSS